MKNLFRFAMAVAVLFTASCAKEDISSSIGGGEVEVTFTANLADMGTRAYGDGTQANVVYLGVYEAGSTTPLSSLVKPEGYGVNTDDGTASITVVLLRDKVYDLVFWAQNKDVDCYTRNWEGRNIEVSYVGVESQAEARDAFFLVRENYKAGAADAETTFKLRRPFAQLNVGLSAEDVGYIKKNGFADYEDNKIFKTSEVTINNVNTVLSLDLNEDGAPAAVSTPTTNVTFAAAAVPTTTLEVNDVEYTHLSMNYLLVNEELIQVDYKFVDAKNTTYERKYHQVPVKRNYRTNIIGQLISSPLDFTVIIKPEFEGDENYDILGRLKDVLANGGDLVLFSDVTLDEPITIPAGKEVNIDLSKYSLTIGAGITVNGALKMSNGQVKVNVEQDGNSDVYVGLNAKSVSSIDFEDVKVSVANKNAAVYTYADNVEINLTNTNITVGEDGHGVFVPQGANNLKVNLVNSTINAVKDGYYGLYLMQTNSTVSIDEDSEINDFWVMGGNVNVVYGGEKPEVKTDGLAVTITYYTEDEFAFNNAIDNIENGGTLTLNEDLELTNNVTIPAGKEVTLNLNGKTISGDFTKGNGSLISIEEGANLKIVGGTLVNTTTNGDAVIKNSGSLVLKDVTVLGAPIGDSGYPNYAIYTSGQMTIEDGCSITSDRGVIYLQNGGDLTINGGNISVTNALGSRALTAHVIYAYGNTSKLTINGGNFALNYEAAGNLGASVICPAGATIDVYGGNFHYAGVQGNQSGIFQNYMGYGAPVNVYGGTYNDSTVIKNVADGYIAIENGDGTWTVYKGSYVNDDDATKFAAALAKGGIVVLNTNITLKEELTLPAGITLNGNGKLIDGTLVAGGNVTFAGHTKVTAFSAGYYNRTITIGEGACLEVTGADRVSLAYGNTFNITGNVNDAKTADKSTIQPSLIIPGGISITGGNDAVFNIKNAYVQIGSTSSKNNVANGEFTLNIENSIAEFTDQLTFAEPKSGKTPKFNINVKNSVLTTGTKLCIAAPNCNMVVDNSTVTLGTYLRNSGILSLSNGSVLTGKTIQFGENGGNNGTINVDASSMTITAGSTGSAFDGKGVGSINATNGATVAVDYYKDMTITVDTTSTFTGNKVQ